MIRHAEFVALFCFLLITIAGLSGCGRRGALEPPPTASAATSPQPDATLQPQSDSQALSSPAASATTTSSSLKPSSRRSKKIIPPKRDTPFDWLL
jgi:predicted small lipoprotein YifL